MTLSANIKQYREDHYISQEYMAEKLAMCQPNYSRLEKNERACTKRLPQLANALGTTPEVLQNYHLVRNEMGELDIADWIMKELVKQEAMIQQQQETIQFQSRYITYIYTVWQAYGIHIGKSLNEPPTLAVLA